MLYIINENVTLVEISKSENKGPISIIDVSKLREDSTHHS